MLIVTTFEIPGYKVDAVLGEVMGLTVRSANIGANLLAGFKAIGGGEITEYTNLVYDSRNQVMQRMWEQCVQRGGNAVVGMRFDTGDIGQSFSEVCAYGTAVVIHPIGAESEGGTPQSIAQANGQSAPPQ
ncbi:MAG: YbjQ family protein [Propionibacteriaceae bacterium]|nr:YbjQ family protein [Propionibacteriaceae bacterium]